VLNKDNKVYQGRMDGKLRNFLFYASFNIFSDEDYVLPPARAYHPLHAPLFPRSDPENARKITPALIRGQIFSFLRSITM